MNVSEKMKKGLIKAWGTAEGLQGHPVVHLRIRGLYKRKNLWGREVIREKEIFSLQVFATVQYDWQAMADEAWNSVAGRTVSKMIEELNSAKDEVSLTEMAKDALSSADPHEKDKFILKYLENFDKK